MEYYVEKIQSLEEELQNVHENKKKKNSLVNNAFYNANNEDNNAEIKVRKFEIRIFF